MPWYALYTKPRQEKKVTEKLRLMGVEAYCPLLIQERQWSDRKKKIAEPLLRSYVFVHLDEKHRDVVFSVSGVVRYLFWLGHPAVIRDSEIETLRHWLQDTVSSYEIIDLQPGDTYKIATGPFMGQEGTVAAVTTHQLVLVMAQLGFKVILKR